MAILWCLQKPLWDVLKVIYMPLCAINFQRLHACIYAFFIPLMCLSVQGYTTLVSLSLLLSLVKIFLKSDLNFWQQAWCGLFSRDLKVRLFLDRSCAIFSWLNFMVMLWLGLLWLQIWVNWRSCNYKRTLVESQLSTWTHKCHYTIYIALDFWFPKNSGVAW